MQGTTALQTGAGDFFFCTSFQREVEQIVSYAEIHVISKIYQNQWCLVSVTLNQASLSRRPHDVNSMLLKLAPPPTDSTLTHYVDL